MTTRILQLLSLSFLSAFAWSDVIGTTPGTNPDITIIRSNTSNVHKTADNAAAYRNGAALAYTADEDGNRLPDFSHAGYMGGGITIPTVSPRQTLHADDADPERDRTADIQKSLDTIAALPLGGNGFRGALLLGKGKFVVSDTIKITAGGIVVRGSGAGFGGTWIYHKPHVMKPTSLEYLHSISPEGGIVPTFMLTAKGGIERRELTQLPAGAFVPCGERVLPVNDASAFQNGMEIIIEVQYTEKWLDALLRPEGWGTRTVVPRLRRRIASADAAARTITLDRPLSLSIDLKNGIAARCRVSQITADTRPYNIGIEDILFISGFDKDKRDKAGFYNDENHPLSVFRCEGAADVWMRRCIAFFYSMSMITPDGSARVTIEDCAMLDGVSRDTPATHTGARKYYFNITADDMLVQRCYARHARHSFVGNGTWEGGVFRDCYSERDHVAVEWHQLYGYGHLYDQVFCHAPITMRGCTNAVHGQCAVFSCAWNCAIMNDTKNFADLWVNRVPGVFNNWAIGNLLLGSGRTSRGEDAGGGHHMGELGSIELSGSYMPIRSLSLAQLSLRKGDDAVRAVTTEVQRTGKHGAVWLDLIDAYARLPIWMDPDRAPWPGLEQWVAQSPNEKAPAITAPPFVRAASAASPVRTAEIDTSSQYLSDMPEESFISHRDTLHKNKRYTDNKPVSIAGIIYPKSLLIHPKADARRGEAVFALTGGTAFSASIGIEDSTSGRGSVAFAVDLFISGEWKNVLTSPVMGGGDAAIPVTIALNGATKIRLVCTDGGDGVSSDHGVWAIPCIR